MIESSMLKIFERHANLKYKYDSRHFWCRGSYVDTVGKMQKDSRVYSEPIKGGAGILMGEPVKQIEMSPRGSAEK